MKRAIFWAAVLSLFIHHRYRLADTSGLWSNDGYVYVMAVFATATMIAAVITLLDIVSTAKLATKASVALVSIFLGLGLLYVLVTFLAAPENPYGLNNDGLCFGLMLFAVPLYHIIFESWKAGASLWRVLNTQDKLSA